MKICLAFLRTIFLMLISLAVLIAPLSESRASQQVGQVQQVAISAGGAPNGITMNGGTRTAKPACATDDLWDIPSPTSDSAKAVLSGLLSAYLSGKTVTVVGTGTCNAQQTSREDINYILLQ